MDSELYSVDHLSLNQAANSRFNRSATREKKLVVTYSHASLITEEMKTKIRNALIIANHVNY